jgi:ubiquitin C-terminal hydrolase
MYSNSHHARTHVDHRRGLTGIDNAGCTCYIAAVLQCVGHCPRLITSIVRPLALGGGNGAVMREVREVMLRKWAQPGEFSGPVPAPLGLIRALQAGPASMMEHDVQNDAHEFLIELMTALETPPVAAGSQEESKNREDKKVRGGKLTRALMLAHAHAHWSAFIARTRCATTELIYGQHAFLTVCGSCGHVSESFDVFATLPLLLTPGQPARFRPSSGVEEIQGFECERCKQRVTARRDCRVSHLPTVLVIHVMRFGGGLCKDTTPVQLEERISMAGALLDGATQDGAHYKLRGVVCHRGHSQLGGHYYAVCRYANGWVMFDDELVTPTTLQAVGGQDPYLLFYEATWV